MCSSHQNARRKKAIGSVSGCDVAGLVPFILFSRFLGSPRFLSFVAACSSFGNFGVCFLSWSCRLTLSGERVLVVLSGVIQYLQKLVLD